MALKSCPFFCRLLDPPPVQTEVDVAFAVSANSLNYMQTFRLMKDTVAWIIGEYGTDKLQYSVILFGADASTGVNFDEDVPTPNLLIQLVQSLSRKSGDPDLTKAMDQAKNVFESAGARPEARKVATRKSLPHFFTTLRTFTTLPLECKV